MQEAEGWNYPFSGAEIDLAPVASAAVVGLLTSQVSGSGTNLMSAAVLFFGATGGVGKALTAFLFSPDVNRITGHVMAVDGGRSSLRTKG